MTLDDLEKRIKEIKDYLKEEFNWTEEDLQKVDVCVCIEDEEGGTSALLNNIEVDAPPLTFYLNGKINPKYRIALEDIDKD